MKWNKHYSLPCCLYSFLAPMLYHYLRPVEGNRQKLVVIVTFSILLFFGSWTNVWICYLYLYSMVVIANGNILCYLWCTVERPRTYWVKSHVLFILFVLWALKLCTLNAFDAQIPGVYNLELLQIQRITQIIISITSW